MQLFYFSLKADRQTVPDCEGVELADEAAARLHAAEVAQQLMRNREVSTRGWRIQVCNDYLQPVFELLFAEVDETLRRFPAHISANVEHVVRTVAAFNDAMVSMQDTIKDVRATLARADRILRQLPGHGHP
jgi:uncharacterized protein DUF6894